MPTPTLQELLDEPEMKSEIIRSIETVMLIIVLFLKYEPEQLETLTNTYETLYTLKQSINPKS
ncbi:MAG: hypothetical protein A2033_18745 [Bacteroidetes bacterium GWA2_31_9]|nr:MAG: hypothetical protein A2033_18745 [Bacteroidetes bacterium GWA2_31_9]